MRSPGTGPALQSRRSAPIEFVRPKSPSTGSETLRVSRAASSSVIGAGEPPACGWKESLAVAGESTGFSIWRSVRNVRPPWPRTWPATGTVRAPLVAEPPPDSRTTTRCRRVLLSPPFRAVKVTVKAPACEKTWAGLRRVEEFDEPLCGFPNFHAQEVAPPDVESLKNTGSPGRG